MPSLIPYVKSKGRYKTPVTINSYMITTISFADTISQGFSGRGSKYSTSDEK